MSLSRFSLILLTLLVLSQAGLGLWRYLPIQPSTAPVFCYPPAVEKFDNPGELAGAIELYQADRGAECNLTPAEGIKLSVFYFEFDRMVFNQNVSMADHEPEKCNVAAGFKLGDILPNRVYSPSGKPALLFDSTRFIDAAGNDLFIFKIPWIQGLGAVPMRGTGDRFVRLKAGFLRNIGAARVLQGGISGARDADHAWQIFQTEVLEKLVWR